MEEELKGMEKKLKGQYHRHQETRHQNYRPFNFQAKRDSGFAACSATNIAPCC